MSDNPTKKKASTPVMPVDLRGDGLLWLVNRVVFHPRGFALAVDGQGGFSLLGDGSEVWTFTEADDDECFVNVEETFESARTFARQAHAPRPDDDGEERKAASYRAVRDTFMIADLDIDAERAAHLSYAPRICTECDHPVTKWVISAADGFGYLMCANPYCKKGVS